MVNALKKLAVYSCFAAISLNCATSLVTPEPSSAQTNSGIILFGKIRDNALEYRLDAGRANYNGDRYYLDLKPQKFQVSEVLVTYPDYYTGEFDPNSIDLRVNNRNLPLESAKWDKESRVISVIPKEPIPPNKPIQLVLSNVRNPTFGGLFQFDARVKGIDDLPMLRYIGSWMIGLD